MFQKGFEVLSRSVLRGSGTFQEPPSDVAGVFKGSKGVSAAFQKDSGEFQRFQALFHGVSEAFQEFQGHFWNFSGIPMTSKVLKGGI